MALKKRGLGKNSLDILLGKSLYEDDPVAVSEPTQDEALRLIPIDAIEPGRFQPRRNINPASIEELAQSIRRQGVIQPIVVRPITTSRYEIIAGERRWRAAKLAELTEIPAIVRDLKDADAMAIGLIENIARENLTPIEEALAIQRLLTEFSLTHQEIAEAVGKSRSAISNLLRLLNLTIEVKKLLENGDIEVGHAKALLSISGELQTQVAKLFVEKELSVREAESYIRKILENNAVETHHKKPADPDVLRLERDISDKLGAKVRVNHLQNGKGKVVIHYNSLDELDGIISHIK